MNDNKKWFIASVVIAALIGSVTTLAVSGLKGDGGSAVAQGGTPGSRTIESMLPGVQQAGGILSKKPMWINASTTLQGLLNVSGAFNLGGALAVTGAGTVAGTFGVATTSTDFDFIVAGAATSTFSGGADTSTTSLMVHSQTALFGGQIILENPDGTACSAISLNDAGTGVDVVVVTCPI